MADQVLIRRTEGTDPPENLAFGELAFADGSNTVFVGKADGTKLPLGTSTPLGLAAVALSGDYDDLVNKPVIPELPALAPVALSGDYDDLSNKPDINVLPDLMPPAGVEVLTNRFYPSGTGFKPVYRNRIIVSSPYPSNNYIERAHGIEGIENVVDYVLFTRGSGYLYKIFYVEIATGRIESSAFSTTQYFWMSAKNKNTDGTTTEGAWFEVEYTKTADVVVTF